MIWRGPRYLSLWVFSKKYLQLEFLRYLWKIQFPRESSSLKSCSFEENIWKNCFPHFIFLFWKKELSFQFEYIKEKGIHHKSYGSFFKLVEFQMTRKIVFWYERIQFSDYYRKRHCNFSLKFISLMNSIELKFFCSIQLLLWEKQIKFFGNVPHV